MVPLLLGQPLLLLLAARLLLVRETVGSSVNFLVWLLQVLLLLLQLLWLLLLMLQLLWLLLLLLQLLLVVSHSDRVLLEQLL